MEKFESVDAVLDFAIAREQEAFDFYHKLASDAADEKMKNLFISFAEVEAGHKRKLEGIKEGTTYLTLRQEPVNLKISDYLVTVDPSPDMSFQDALIVAMKREKKANALYTNMASTVDDAMLAELFSQLAKEEAGHKARFESLYEEHFLREN